MPRSHVVVSTIVLVLAVAQPSSGALVQLEWSGEPGVIGKTLQVGETATIDIRLDLVAGETFGAAIDFPLGVGSWWSPDPAPNFQITGIAADGELGPGHGYDRSAIPPLPVLPEEYLLKVGTYVPTVSGPATVYLDRLEISALSAGHDDIVFGDTFQGRPNSDLLGADNLDWIYVDGYTQPLAPEVWSFGVGHPGRRPSTPHGAGLNEKPLRLDVVPEPGTLALLSFGAFALHFRKRRRR
ncbi:MAG: PEP-CTERM sorting domain-containing protein [Phycisphaerales bacterium]|nr:PEP-CTERM sorting domain-containing protein [Phycisphaerales bacterium]